MMIFTHNMMIMIIITKGSYIRLRLGAPLKANGGISSIRFRSSRLGNKNHDDDDDDDGDKSDININIESYLQLLGICWEFTGNLRKPKASTVHGP